ncbi:hypothetical protein TWF679_007305 [Orbilia oligospora]|uniref:Uncharacterized protein n=1 Tax=Orbilia oligospora TaxID=2813651 RepID=A0A8H8V841_ORBOL|nr:hypothetical protein TWF679_007305 [Orbilia oligospora]
MSSPPRQTIAGNGSPVQKKTQTVPIVDTVTTPKKRGGPPPLPSTPPGKGNSPTRLPTTPTHGFGSPGSPFGSPKPQFTSKSSIPGRWLPSYPEESTSHSGSQATLQSASQTSGNKKGKANITEIFHSIKSQSVASSVVEAAAEYTTDAEQATSPKLPSSSSSRSSSSRERTPPFTIYEEAALKPSDSSKTAGTSQAEPTLQAPTPTSNKVPAILQASQGYGPNNPLHSPDSLWGMKKGKTKSPETLRRMLSEAQDRERVDDELVKMNVIPPTAPIIGVSGKSSRQNPFPSFPIYEGPKNKPFAPDDMVLRSMADIPQFLEKFKPKEVRALFGNYIASCDDIDNMACPMRIGQLSIFIPINMRNGEIITVGLAPAELFHTDWKGTGSPVPIPDRSIIGKRAYAVIVQQPLPADFIVSRSLAVPTGNTQGTVIGIVGSACILRVEKWFLRSEHFNTQSRVIPVMGELPDKPKLVLYNSPRIYDEHKAELERMALERKDQGSRLSVKDLGGTFYQIPKGKTLGWDIKVLDFGPIGPPKYLSISSLGGEPEPRSKPKRVPWGNIDNGTANNGPDEKAASTLVPSSTATEAGTMMESEAEAPKDGSVDPVSTDKKKEVVVVRV